MPIVRSYFCEKCAHAWNETLSLEQADDPPPACPYCLAAARQEFKPVAIAGAAAMSRKAATEMAQTIAAEDYNVADMQVHPKYGVENVRYKDTTNWTGINADLASAMAVNREDRIKFGTGLDVLQHNLRTGVQPDLIEASKRRSAKVW
jgi:hypothetical protein